LGTASPAPAATPADAAETSPRPNSSSTAPPPAPMAVSPYLSLGWGDPPAPATVMAATGVRWFSLAFVLSSGACEPRWDGYRPLKGGVDARTVAAVRVAGGDVVPSFGGGGGDKLEEKCPDAASLAGAYRKVIDAYGLKAIDIDLEGSAYRSAETQRRTLDALARLKKADPGLVVYVTVPSYRTGPDSSLIDRAAEAEVEPDAWSVMPFSFVPSAKGEDMGRISTRAVDGLKERLASAYGYTDTEAYAHSGISSMNGITGEGETITVRDFRTVAAHARKHGLGRLAFWSVNRDRPCGGRPYPAEDACSGVAQRPWEYTKTLAQHGR
ncbi:chitinase, partial [Streptomyces nanshensis]